MIKAIFSFFTGGGLKAVLSSASYALVGIVVAIAVWQINTWFRVNPVEKSLATSRASVTATADSLLSAKNDLTLRVREVGELQMTIQKVSGTAKVDRISFDRQIVGLQSTLRTVVDASRGSATEDSIYINKLESGVRVDLVRLVFRKPLFSDKLRLTDSTYTIGVGWGFPVFDGIRSLE